MRTFVRLWFVSCYPCRYKFTHHITSAFLAFVHRFIRMVNEFVHIVAHITYTKASGDAERLISMHDSRCCFNQLAHFFGSCSCFFITQCLEAEWQTLPHRIGKLRQMHVNYAAANVRHVVELCRQPHVHTHR